MLSHVFDGASELCAEISEVPVIQLINACKNTVRFAKKSRLQPKLESSLKPAGTATYAC